MKSQQQLYEYRIFVGDFSKYMIHSQVDSIIKLHFGDGMFYF